MGFSALWIKTSINLPRHPKIEKLANTLNISIAEAVGRVVMIWIYALEFRPSGIFATAEEIARAADWPRDDSENFVNALIYCGEMGAGFLEIPNGNQNIYAIHDWQEFSGGSALDERRGRRKKEEYKKEEKTPAQAISADKLDAALRIVPKDKNHEAFLQKLGVL